MPKSQSKNKAKLPCPYGCRGKGFDNASGRTQHITIFHSFNTRPRRATPPRALSPPPFDEDFVPPINDEPPTPPPVPKRRVDLHPRMTARPCDRDGNFLAPDAPAPPKIFPPPDDFSPYRTLNQFRMADFLYRRVQMSSGEIDELMDILDDDGNTPPFKDHKDMYATIDATEHGHVPWEAFEVAYDGAELDEVNAPSWKRKGYSVYYRDPRAILNQQLANPDFKDEMDLSPQRVYDEKGEREYKNFMSGDWAWRQADEISKDPATHGSVFVPIISGSDKTTTSVATGQNDFYPLYVTNGLVHNTVRRAHRNAVSLVGFLAIPKTDREHQNSAEFRTFRRRLFHASLRQIFSSLKPGMTIPEVVEFGDGHFRRVIYGLGPYIADYPEQVLLACVVQGWCARCHASNKDLDGEGGRRTQAHTQCLFDAFDPKALWDQYGVLPDVLPFTWGFPRADIYELLSPDLLHQVIKGTFKDHLVTWVGEYLELVHGKSEAAKIMADIDRRIAAVYLPAIEGHVPPQMVRAFSAFLDFCYLVRRNVINDTTLGRIREALARYHRERVIFEASGVCPNGFCLPRQHSLTHYDTLITEFAAPNGLCSSITESKHIKAVKEPWRRSSKYEALHQMLTINDRLDNLAATRVDFEARGILQPKAPDPTLPVPLPTEAAQRLLQIMAEENDADNPDGPEIEGELRSQDDDRGEDDSDVDDDTLPPLPTSVMTFPSAIATFFAPSDHSSSTGLLHERIRAVPSWRNGPPRYDCVYIAGDDQPGFRGLLAARTLLFMSFKHEHIEYPCALVTWFSAIGENPCPDVGMWMVEPDLDDEGERVLDIIHVDTILRAAHLIPIFGTQYLPHDFQFTDSLDSFQAYYVNKYADHHSHEILF
ncbi:hypothetical protein GGX14DRAFT_538195 [Mycena pura]|uniref:C2H2-type domain-containing protein n=1 Tax=Mycena pura TaxID=153505 RepID=A0AAD6UKW7_9AGAR|nr:hypothetical protein GGX14DRAFT_538195 [Mycena pura]